MMTAIYVYDSAFQTMASVGSAHAARRTVSAMLSILPPLSVIDFGCARGAWLREWRAQGVQDIVGVDGAYVDRANLEFDPARFVSHDLATPFSHGRRFELAQSLEVAEHLPPSRARSFVADLTAHAPAVLFSAAQPGQGGENHVNEQPAEYWRRLFAEHGHVAIDCLRPLLARDSGVPAWYRYNLFLYVHRAALHRVAPFARQFQVADGEALPDPSPLPYRLRKMVVRTLPPPVRNQLARLNARRFAPDPSNHPSAGSIQ
jgi:hypothetical protein